MKMSVRGMALALVLLCTVSSMAAQGAPAGPVSITHLMGLQDVKSKAKGKVTVEGGSMQFTAGKSTAKVPVASVEEINVGSEATQAGGNYGRAAKAGAVAGPPGTGAALTLLLHTKVDILTISYRGPENELHAAIFSTPKGEGEKIKAQLVAGGAHPR